MLTVVNLKIINVHTIIFSCQISVSKQAKSMLVFFLLHPTSFFLYICIKLSELLSDLVHNRLLVYWASINVLKIPLTLRDY